MRRPDFTQAVQAFMTHVARLHEVYAHVDGRRVLVVAGEARRASRATVRPLRFPGGKLRNEEGRRKPLVRYHGVPMLYAITLRPLFFRRSSPRERVATLLHELFHISPAFDGSLDGARRHAQAGTLFEDAFRPVERAVWRQLDDAVLAPFTHDGEVRVLQWLEKPQSWLPGEKASGRTAYHEGHLFEGVVRMKTRLKRRPKLD